MKYSSGRAEYKIDWLALNNAIKRKKSKVKCSGSKDNYISFRLLYRDLSGQRVLFSVYRKADIVK